jgi:uncharacterized membrane protein (DUF485 family)
MLHEPANIDTTVDKAADYKASLGLKLFALYGVIYLGFILINVFKPELMKIKTLFGLNLATFYGFSLIIIAVVMGLIYNSLCTKKEDQMNKVEAE